LDIILRISGLNGRVHESFFHELKLLCVGMCEQILFSIF